MSDDSKYIDWESECERMQPVYDAAMARYDAMTLFYSIEDKMSKKAMDAWEDFIEKTGLEYEACRRAKESK